MMASENQVAGITVSRYAGPDIATAPSRGKWSGGLHLRAGHLSAGAMVISKHGGENNLHAHPDTDSIWIVISGKVRFHGMNDTLVAELGPVEGVSIPKGVPYWFENTEEEDAVIYHITARDPAILGKEFHRVNFAPYKASQTARGERPGRVATEEEKKSAAAL